MMTNNRLIGIFCAGLLTLVACGNNDPYHPVNPDNGGGVSTLEEYTGVALSGGAQGSFTTSGSEVTVTSESLNGSYGVCVPASASRQFMAEVTADRTENIGLAVVRLKNGVPDLDNYTSVSLVRENGAVTARVIDRQKGRSNVLDNTGRVPDSDREKRYALKLDGSLFSMPFTGGNGRLRVMRNSISGFFHFYVGVSKEMNGRMCDSWVELAPSKDWCADADSWAICPFVRTGGDAASATAKFSDIDIRAFDPQNLGEGAGAFSLTEGDYTWAGFPGHATVINFDPKFCPASDGNRQFVFWSEANYVPAWRMNNELLYSYEFCETWGSPKGCCEPMSDRMLAFCNVETVEDNDVRKVVKYHYELVNPDYQSPYGGNQRPEIDEYYTLYPDGVGVRRVEYTQKSMGAGRYNYHELSEPMAISGSSTKPADHFKSPAMTISNLSGSSYNIHPDKPDGVNNNVPGWPEQIYTAHLASAPDAFSVWSYTPERPEVSPLPISVDFDWHWTGYEMSHWPVSKMVYDGAFNGDYDKNMAIWSSQVSHSSLIGIEAKGDTSWGSAYQTRPNGDKYRVYLMLMGIVNPGSNDEVNAYTRSWLYMGEPSNLSGVTFDAATTGYSRRETVLKSDGSASCAFTMNPSGSVKNPVFRIDGWKGDANVTVTLAGEALTAGTDYLAAKSGGNLVIWVNRTLSGSFRVEVK